MEFELFLVGHEVVGPRGGVITSKVVGATSRLTVARKSALRRSRLKKWRVASRMVVIGLALDAGQLISERLVSYRGGRRVV